MPKVRRYSGGLKLELSFNDRSMAYQVRICPTKAKITCERVVVGAPKHLTHAVDSQIAYDKAAHAAISFAREDLQELADTDRQGRGWAVRRPGRKGVRR